ncbi:cupin domain-containing protein [Arhodomonas sp. SL1]|uniref:cupin domain-containing protein n=1 Tax=Arhodomonas sp. SL1 TaxID=3425691 RepID=UPI003F88424E
MPAPFGTLSREAFVERYWQQRPLVVRGAFPEPPAGLSAEELAGLATEADVESRVVMGETAREDWILLHGPFEPEFFQDTPDADWTLLVQDVDKHLPALAAWLAPFRFVPGWRFDDLMVSYAAPGGTVGPHVDRYDVFLIQGQGRRRWAIQDPPPEGERLRGHPDLRLLADFEATDEWVLEPGDMLYLPPGIPHYGVAEDDCLTYSVGFRAPSGAELLAAWARGRVDANGDAGRYHDAPGALPPPGRLTTEELSELRRLIREAAAADDDALDDWIARYLTEPKAAFRDLHGEEETVASVATRLATDAGVLLNPAARLVLAETTGGRRWYLQGQLEDIPAAAAAAAERLAAGATLHAGDLPASANEREAFLEWLADWRHRGLVVFTDELSEEEDDGR